MQNLEITKELGNSLKLPTIHFSYNWNNKLNCKSFSTVRIWNPDKYELLDIYQITLKVSAKQPEVLKGFCRLQAINKFYLSQVTPGISFLDANLSRIDFHDLILKMYKNKNIDFKRTYLCFLVLQYLPASEILELAENLK